ncbi:MAG: hypothetical protein WCP38_00385 [Chloroflexota bacterium]
MADPTLKSVPPLKRPLLLLACVVTLIAMLIGFSGTDERLLLAPAAVALVWAAAYRAQPDESVRQLRPTNAGVVVIKRSPQSAPRRRTEMPPTPSGYAPSAAVATAVAQARATKSGEPLVKRVQFGLPDRPTAVVKEKESDDKEEAKVKRRKSKAKGDRGKPTLGL